jgi:hypothetical protein
MARSIIARRAVRTPHPNASNITEAQELLQRNISAMAEHERNRQAFDQIKAAKLKLDELQSRSCLIDATQMECFLKRTMEMVDRAMLNAANPPLPDVWEHMT